MQAPRPLFMYKVLADKELTSTLMSVLERRKVLMRAGELKEFPQDCKGLLLGLLHMSEETFLHTSS